MMRTTVIVTMIFLLIGVGTTRVLADTSEQAKLELAFWNSIKDSSDPAVFRAYLKRFPNGVFSELSKIKIRTLDPTSEGASKIGASKHVPSVTSQKSFNLLDGKWVGKATIETVTHEGADCPSNLDFDVAIESRKIEGAVRQKTDGGAINGTVVSKGEAHSIDATILVRGWVDALVPLVGSYANERIRGEIGGTYCVWSMTLTKAN